MKGHSVIIRWVPGRSGLIGNGKADLAAKNRAERGGNRQRWSSLAYINRKLTYARCKELTKWHRETKMQEREASRFTSLGQRVVSTRYLETPRKNMHRGTTSSK